MPYAYDILEPRAVRSPALPGGAVSRGSDTRSSTADRSQARLARPSEGDRSGRGDTCPIDPRVFRPEVFDAVWPKIVGVRAAQAQRTLTPEAWRRLWLNGYAHLRDRNPVFYAATPEGAACAIAVLAPLMRRIEADFRTSGAASGRSARPPVSIRGAPSAVTLLRWQDAEAHTRTRASRTPWTNPNRLQTLCS